MMDGQKYTERYFSLLGKFKVRKINIQKYAIIIN